MGYRTLADCVADLERSKQLVRIDREIDPNLEAAEIQRRVYRAGGPAIYFFKRVRDAVPHGVQPLWHDRANAISVSRCTRPSPQTGRTQNRSRTSEVETVAVLGFAVHPLAIETCIFKNWPHPSKDDFDPIASAIEMLATRWRSIRHLAASVYGASR